MQLFRLALACPALLGLLACGNGPSQTSRYIEGAYSGNDGMVYSLPRGVINISIKRDTGKITIAAPTVSIVPDSNARFAALWKEESFANDHFTFQTTEDGLLKSINSVNKDETPAIVGKAIEIAKQVAIDAVGVQTLVGGASDSEPNFQISKQADPFRPGALKKLRDDFGPYFDIDIKRLDGSPLKSVTDETVKSIASECDSAVCLRLPVPIRISLRSKAGEVKERVVAEFISVIPDPSTLVRYEIVRGPCIQRQTDLTFEKGMLTKAELQKPSEILQCLEIPLSIAKAVAEIPSAVLTARVKIINEDKGLIEAQSQYLSAITALINNQNSLIKTIASK